MVGEMAYRLELPETVKVHLVFHVSCLKRKLGSHVHPLPRLPPVSAKGKVLLQSEFIVYRRMQRLGNRAMTEVLVKWLGSTNDDNSWKRLKRLKEL